MSAVERVINTLTKVWRVREGEYRAPCPVHQGRSNSSLSIKDVGDRVLVHCHNGCKLEDILAALEMRSAAELFDSVRTSPDPEIKRRRDAAAGLRKWREEQLMRTAAELRSRDAAILKIDSDVESGRISESQAWESLAPLYVGYSDLEDRFEVLCAGTDRDALEIYRWMKSNRL